MMPRFLLASRCVFFSGLTGCVLLAAAFGQPSKGRNPEAKRIGHSLPAGFTVPKSTLSPDGRYGVLVPDENHYILGVPKNAVVNLRSGEVIGTIRSETGLREMNHGGVLPSRWSSDSSLLLWKVSDKWCPRALALVRLRGDKIVYQLDLLHIGQAAILERTRRRLPKRYAAAKAANAGNGAYFPDGFTVDVGVQGPADEPVRLPMRVHVSLTSNPKGIERMEATELDSDLDAVVTRAGKFKVVGFKLAKNKNLESSN